MRLESLIGTRLGRYAITKLLGRGGMAAVFQADDHVLRRPVALKILYSQFLSDATLVERFRSEAIIAARLEHPNIVPIYDVGEAEGLVYIAMKLLPGRSLQDELQMAHAALSTDRVVDIVEGAAHCPLTCFSYPVSSFRSSDADFTTGTLVFFDSATTSVSTRGSW